MLFVKITSRHDSDNDTTGRYLNKLLPYYRALVNDKTVLIMARVMAWRRTGNKPLPQQTTNNFPTCRFCKKTGP